MIPRPLAPPPVQEGRRAVGPAAPAGPQVAVAYAPLPPPAGRLEARPVVLDGWGHATLAGLAGDRLVVPAGPAQGDLAAPLACAVAGFLLAGWLAR